MGQLLHVSGNLGASGDPGSLADQVKELQLQVERLASAAIAANLAMGRNDPTTRMARAVRILMLRQTRQTIFGNKLFGEPAWDMLLQLYASTLSGRKECVSSLCVASGVPSTTALRWISLLESRHWIEKHSDPLDGRRTFVAPTRKCLAAMDRFLGQTYLVQAM